MGGIAVCVACRMLYAVLYAVLYPSNRGLDCIVSYYPILASQKGGRGNVSVRVSVIKCTCKSKSKDVEGCMWYGPMDLHLPARAACSCSCSCSGARERDEAAAGLGCS